MDPSSFRVAFPEFSDTTRYPDSLIQTWLTVATMLVNADRWGDLTTLGVQLVAAHHIAIERKDIMAAAGGGVPGAISGPTSSKSVDKVSISYDTSSVALDDAGFWGLTSYGLRFLTLGRMFGAGGFQV